MTPKQTKFINEYLIDLNATQAAVRAGYSERTAYSIGQENLKKPEIKQKIDSELALLHRLQKDLLIMAVESAITALKDILENGPDTARVQAANSILDRAGHKAISRVQSDINSNISAEISVEDARQELLEKLNRAFPTKEIIDG